MSGVRRGNENVRMYLVMLIVLVVLVFMLLGWKNSRLPTSTTDVDGRAPAVLPTASPTPTPTPGWWNGVESPHGGKP